MTVKRIVPNFLFANPREARSFYQEIFDLDVVMDQGWIVTFAADAITRPQLSVASQGGNGTQVPSISIEVDNVDEVYEKAQRFGAEIVYAIANEEWGVRRFYVCDPSGMVISVLAHA